MFACILMLLILQLQGIQVVFTGTPANTTAQFEVECHNVASMASQGSPATFNIPPFRNDTLTTEEKNIYTDMQFIGGVPAYKNCYVQILPEGLFPPETYLYLHCYYPAHRDHLMFIAGNVSAISPNRAVVVRLDTWGGYDFENENPIDHEAFEPIRSQVIQLDIRRCYTPNMTFQVYQVGVLPNLVALDFAGGKDLILKKKDFSRMPNIRMIYFIACTIQDVEPYTFTDLPHLISLTLERGADLFIQASDLCAPLMPWKCMDQKSLTTIQRLHCDCSFAWYRNFLRKKPFLIQSRESGDVWTTGTYKTPARFSYLVSERLHVLSVDCARNLTNDNTESESMEYSYNVNCYDTVC